jgi:hypothetical protein
MASDDQALFLVLLSLFAVAGVVVLLSLVLAPGQLRSAPKDASRFGRYVLALRRALGLSAMIIGALILTFHAVLVCIAFASARGLANQAPALEAAVLQLAVCGAFYWASVGAAPSAVAPTPDDQR